MHILKLMLLASISILCAAQDLEITSLANQLRNQIAKSGKKVIAIWDITNNQAYTTDFAQYLENELSVKLLQDSPSFKLVTRSQLNKVMKEQGLASSKQFDPSTFKKVNNFIGADAIITGTFHVLPASVRVTFQVLDVSDAAMLTGVSGPLPMSKDIEAYLGKVALEDAGPGPPPPPLSERVVEAGPFIFRLQQCSANSTFAICKFKISSPKQDRRLSVASSCCMHPRSLLFDQDGNEFGHSKITVGSKTSSSEVDLLLIRDTQVSAEIVFPLNRDIQSISLLRILAFDEHGGHQVDFRNLRLAVSGAPRPATKR